jgi:hypothetical protein
MKSQKITLFLLTWVSTCVLTSCKKDYVCECVSIYGTTNTTIHDTKKKAVAKCDETISQGSATCKIK